MSQQQPLFPPPSTGFPMQLPADSTVWDRISNWVSENKAVVYGVTVVVVAGAGVFYYTKDNSKRKADALPKLSKKERRKRKEAEKRADAERKAAAPKEASSAPLTASVDTFNEIPEVTEASLQTMSLEDRKKWAVRLKEAGNHVYGSKDFNKAIGLYSKAILCKPEAVYYSNRAACYNALSDWNKVVEDTTAALNLEPEYVKAMNRRANAYDKLGKYSESLLDYTASCIIDSFKNASSAEAVERLLKEFAESKAREILADKPSKLPSPTFVSNYLQSFRVKARAAGLEDSTELPADTGKGQLQLGLRAMETKTSEGYEEAANAFDKAVALNDLGPFEAFAYNMRGTFTCLRGKHQQALEDLSRSIELDPSMTQSYVKRASMSLELGDPEKAAADFELALTHNPDDPDLYYHRAQLHFIKGEFAEAAKDYQKSIDLDSDFIFSHIQLGVTQYKMGSIASSMATFRRCIKNFGKVSDVYNYYGELLLDQGNYQEAIEKFESAIELEKQEKPTSMNVLPLINKALAIFQEKGDFAEAEKLCQKALTIDPECDIAVATMAQLLLQQGKVTEALQYFERAAELARTEGELVNALSYAEATRTQILVQEKYPALAMKLQKTGPVAGPGFR